MDSHVGGPRKSRKNLLLAGVLWMEDVICIIQANTCRDSSERLGDYVNARDFDLVAEVVRELPISDEHTPDMIKVRTLLATAFAHALEKKFPQKFDKTHRQRFFRGAQSVDYWEQSQEMSAAIRRLRTTNRSTHLLRLFPIVHALGYSEESQE